MMKNIVVITLGYYPDMSPVSAVLDKYIQILKGKYHFHIIALQTRETFEPLGHFISNKTGSKSSLGKYFSA